MNQHVFYLRNCRTRRILEGDGPARRLAGKTQLALEIGAVDLDHDAVNFVGQRIAALFPVADVSEHVVDGAGELPVGIDLEAGSGERAHGFSLLVEIRGAVDEQHVGVKIEAALGGDVRLQHAHGAGGCVTRIGEARLAGGLTLLVHALEGLGRHDDFAANFKIGRNLRCLGVGKQRDGADSAHVGRDVFSDGAVAARDRPLEARAGVAQGHGKAVELEFADVLDFLPAAELVDAPLPVTQLFFVVCIVEREHGRGVLDLDEALARTASNALGGRVGRDQVWVLLL